MTKHFCDRCGDELSITTATGAPGFDGQRIPIGTGFSTATAILISKDGPGVLCLHCVLDTIAVLDDRPKVALTGIDAQGLPIGHEFHALAVQGGQVVCICGEAEDHPIHKKPEVVNPPSLFGGPVKE